MAEASAFETCPKCGGPMAPGFLATEQVKAFSVLRGMKCARVLWTEGSKMGFLGPKGEDVSAMNVHKKYMFIPAVRCPACRFIAFRY